MENYSPVIRRIIDLLLLLLVTQRVENTSIGGDITVDTTLTLNGSAYFVSQDLVVTENATLTIQPGVQLHFKAGVALQVKGSLQAKGNSNGRIVFSKIPTNGSVNVDDLNVTAPYNNRSIRLIGGKNYRVGRLEIFQRGQWGTVCDDRFDINDARVACRQLGFLGITRFYTHGRGTGPIWLDDMECKGNEQSLLDCKHRGIGVESCAHSEDIGVECHSLAKLLSSKVYWKGIDFSSAQKTSSLQYVDVSQAYEAIKGGEYLPDLEYVTLKRSVYGVKADKVSSPLTINNSSIKDNQFAGIQIKGRLKSLTIQNSAVGNTSSGDGMLYSEIVPDPVDFCSADVNAITFPINLQAFGKARTNVECTKIIRTQPGRHLVVHYQSIAGEKFELHVHDGNTINATQLTLVNEWTGVYQAVTPSSSSGSELYFKFRFSVGRRDAKLKFLITDDQDVSSLVISNSTFNDNHGKGISLKDFTGKLMISTTDVFRNKGEGMAVERISGEIAATKARFINNSANGLAIFDSSLVSCNLHELSNKGNVRNGVYLQRVALRSNVSDSTFSCNALHGFAITNGAGEIDFRNINAFLNTYSGVRIYDGKVSSNFRSSNLSKNREDGCRISNQAGSHQFFNCTAHSNLRYGLSLFDVRNMYHTQRHQFTHFSLEDSTLTDNTQYGLKLGPECQYWSDSVVNVTMAISKNQIARNKKGGIIVSPDSCRWNYNSLRPRRLETVVINNCFEQNKGNTFYAYCTGFLGLDAVIESNTFINNTDKILTLFDNFACGANYKSNAVNVKIDKNIFTKNRAENVLYIDYGSFAETRHAIVRNNTFEDNEVITKELFPNFFRRSTTRAVIVLREGTFSLRENSLDNAGFAFQLSTLRHDYRQSVDAKFNWWGTVEECEIVDKIFDFQHRVQLSPVEFFPYLLSSKTTRAVNSSILRPSCFLKGARIGGILDIPLTLSSAVSSFEVRDDIIILTNGSLSIPKNVTLQFPSRSAMVVQGTLLVDGTEKEKVRFLKKQPQRGFRLGGGAGPWEGRVEFWVNDTWWPMCLPYWRWFTNEGKIICQQLDLYYHGYGIHSSPAGGPGFVHNVVCDANVDGDIMNCSGNTWSYGPSCWGYTVQVYCHGQHYNWAGLHLTMTNHKSSLEHLEIHDAGYAYRSDIQIPGAALKVDLFHHNISNVFINNSLGIGVQVVYQSIVHNQSLMPHSAVSNTKSHGVLSRSPSLQLTDVNLTRNDLNGFIYESKWDKINTFTSELASADVYKTFHVCSENKSFLEGDKVFHFTLEKLDYSLELRCQHIMETEPGYKFVIQDLYNSLSWQRYIYHFAHVYDGVNTSVGSPWKMESFPWKDRPAFNSTKSSIAFDLYKRRRINLVINFLVYTVKEREQLNYCGGEISISRCKIADSQKGSILIGGNELKSLSITDTGITNSKEFGIKLISRGIELVKFASIALERNNQGIVINPMYSGSKEFTIENCAINGSWRQGMFIYSDTKSTIRIVNSTITNGENRALHIQGLYREMFLNLFISDSTFAWNKKGAVSCVNTHRNVPVFMRFESNNFFRNQGPTVEIFSGTERVSWVFRNNSFIGNRGFSVIALGTSSYSGSWYRPNVVVSGNKFLANQCPDKAVIDIRREASSFIIENNKFEFNSGRCVLLEGTAAYVPISMADNIFNENDCGDRSVVEALRLDQHTNFENNTFAQNRAGGVFLLQVVHNHQPAFQKKRLTFKNNTLSNNTPSVSAQWSPEEDSCAVVISGILYHKETDFRFNKFNNSKYPRELCIWVPSISPRNIVSVTHNWWGTEVGRQVRGKIRDFDDNYDFAIADDWPFLLSDDDPPSTAVEQHDFNQHGSFLSGRLFDSMTLKLSQSPYIVTSDLTVLGNATLIIEAGVIVKVYPGMSILVAGALKAHGTLEKSIIFTVKEPASSNNVSDLPVRLVDGAFPWEGRAELFHNGSWKPMSASSNTPFANITAVVCRQLGYGPSNVTKANSVFRWNLSHTWLMEFHCYGNETFLQECLYEQRAFNYSSPLVVVKCQGAPWGNIRFISRNDVNGSQTQSLLNHVEFSHCGYRHGMAVPAVEAVINLPRLESISIRNCTSGGLRVHFPGTDMHLSNSTFVNTGEAGITFLQTQHNIQVESSESSRNQRGISFEEPTAENIPGVHYGRAFLCDAEKVVNVRNQTLLYFDIPRLHKTMATENCEKVLTVPKGQGIKLNLLYFKGSQRLMIYDSPRTVNLIVDRSNNGITSLVHKEIFIPRDTILLKWSGDVNSEVVIQLEDININDSPCTFELDFCGWQTFDNMTINGLQVTRTWRTARYTWPDARNDFSYFHSNGKRLLIGNDRWPTVDGRGAIISPPITKLSKLCSFAFFFRVVKQGTAGLSLYIQTGAYPNIEQKLIWEAKNVEVSNWRKVIVELPHDLEEYRLLFEGEYNKTTNYWRRNFVTIDNLELRSCSKNEHHILNSVLSNNIRQAISYTSVSDGSDKRPRFTTERCKITNTPASPINTPQQSTIFLEIQDNNFTLANNFISGNRLGGIHAQLGRSDGTSLPRSLIYGNTLISNANGTILIEERKESKLKKSFVYIVENAFGGNLGHGSTIELSEIQSEIVSNFFYNNSGLHSIEYDFSNVWLKEQKCESNTFYLNKGLGQNYSVTIVSNGPMEYHSNNLKNPSNLYEFSSTAQAVSDPIDAARNWWGVGIESSVGSRIYDKEDDYRLAAVEYKPFKKLPPRNILSIGCPADWLNVKSMCFVFRSGGRTLKEARNYCQYYGGHVASPFIPDNMEFINMAMQASRPDGKQPVPVWVTTENDLKEESGSDRTSVQCTVMTHNRIKKVVSCNSIYPFVCTRTAVIRCPYGCFHNGDCVGATCFCYRGWTGHDCSQFHCNDVHNCSGRGQCVGPNVCKCTPGFIGRGCSYSYCTKFRRCSTCSQDSACGWCDSSQQCMPGTSVGPYANQCPDWFYYTCYTIGSVNYCSNKIQRVDCTNRQCNATQETTTSESCQKCKDLEKCYNFVEKGRCRAWNETRCPHGLVQVDYADPNRINNTVIKSNVKVIDPNTTIVYSCPILFPGQDEATSVFVTPRGLGIKVGDVLSSAQAGGVMHKVNNTMTTGPYTMIVGTPSKIEDVIQYADFTQKVSAVELVDDTTLDEEPNLDDLYGLTNGNIQLNNTDLHVLPADTSVFKCVGQIYKVDDDLVSTQFLVIHKDHAINVRPGDVVVSAQSHGFIEKIVRANQTSDMVFLETELERCTENSTWKHKFKPRVQGSSSDNDVICTGGDNSYGLIITELDGEQQQISVNDSIIGRNSNPFIAKVVESHVTGEFILIEVLPVQSVLNGTAVTIVSLVQLHKKHRRYKRQIDKDTLRFRKSHRAENKISIAGGRGYINVQQTFKINADFIVSMGVFTDKDENGELVITDALFGLEMVGEVIYNVDVQIAIEVSREYTEKSWEILRPVQIGPNFCVPITGVCIPCAFFLEANGNAVVKVVGKAYVPLSLRTSVRLGMGGFCTRRGGCNTINPLFKFTRRLTQDRVKAEVEIATEVLLTPKLTFRLPSLPRFLRNLVNRFNSLWKKVFKKFLGYRPGDSSTTRDFSILRLSTEYPFGIKAAVKPCSDKCKSERKPFELALSFGVSEAVGRLAIGFGEKNYELPAFHRKLYSGAWEPSFCLPCENSKPACGCPTTPPPTTTERTTTERTTTEKTTAATTDFTTGTATTVGTTEVTTGTATTVGTTEVTTGTATTVGTTEVTTGTATTVGTTERTTITGTTKATTPPTENTTPYTGTTSAPTSSGTTPPPTTPPPCECADGEKGILDENGNCDCPPECPKGKKAVIVNNRYECPDHPPCGEHPNCVVGRKGPGCSQPDVQPCSAGCSGNGVAVAVGDCGSRCVCSVRWTGTCCETRRPWRNWGDPHLETLDGIEYDYYGIGEFWGCKSLLNDFGMQFRYFAYERASLTGGVAVKAGLSVLSIMSVNTTDAKEFPKLRIDGKLVNVTARVGQKMKLDNGTVVMDIQKTFSSQSDETGVVLISLQYESGLTLTADVRHSHVMGRQYLNVLFTPTASFKGHTEGLCGVMDNDPSNDLKGPDGEQYNDPIQFADSWRITAVRNDSGLKGTWSWNSSNFHSDDVMDSSYNDPNFIPVYSLDGISDAIVEKATAACTALGLSDSMLKSCIYDVAVTNDTSLTAQETLQQDCPDQCSGKGRCVNGTCQCMIGWSGDSCEFGNCTDCSTEHGKCVKGFCECEEGWEGVTCGQKATCFNVNNCTSPINGICQRTDQCRCHDGYIGRDCSIIPTCSNVSDCSGRGICIDYDVCKCGKEWTGEDCTQFSCGSLDHCSGHGRCVAFYKCDCEAGWAGASCALPDCAGVNQCSGQGECVSSDTCQCYPGFQGFNCSEEADCAILGNCSGNGVCMQEKQGGDLTCRCYAGFSGSNCSLALCLSVNNCSGHGQCLEADLCSCHVGYTGADCANVSCEGVNYCSGHGVCTGYDTCACDPLWHGPACSVADCSSFNHCSSKGDCILPNTCECYPGYDGAACNTTAKPNLHAPVFAAPLYNATVLENSPIGTKILRVQASDADSGRNAQLLFSLDNGNVASPSFIIDSISGEVFTSSALDFESSSPHLFNLKIVASDNGNPRKSSFVFMYINVLDVNDHCPVFDSFHTKWFNISQHTHPGTLLTVISASDRDSGLNAEVRYGLSYANNLDGAFNMGEENGELTVVGELKAKEYRLLIVARDLGKPSCSSQTVVTVNVFGESAVTKGPSEISTTENAEAESTVIVFTTAKTDKIPVSAPTKSWYKNPMTIMGISMGGFFVLCIVLVLILVTLTRKLKRKVKVNVDSPLIRSSRLGGITRSAASSCPSTPDCNVIEDLEMEQLEVVLRGIKTTEAFEMKPMRHLDF